MIRFCRDCINFEDRRDIDGVILCEKNQGPYVCCEEFTPNEEPVNRLYKRFCIECKNYQKIDDISICAMNHKTGVACEEFVDKLKIVTAITQNNIAKTILTVYALKNLQESEPLPELLVEIGHKIKW